MLQLTFDINGPIMLSTSLLQLWGNGRGREFRGWNCAAGWGTNSGPLAMMEEGADEIWVRGPCNGSCWRGNGKKRFLLYPDGSSFHTWFWILTVSTWIPGCHWWACQWKQLVTRAEMVGVRYQVQGQARSSPPATSKSGFPSLTVLCLWGIVRDLGSTFTHCYVLNG